ncbi:MAG: carbamate kinase [Bacteroidales bacterium]|nr:carbamate kinase [Bacteroidales bacterium]
MTNDMKKLAVVAFGGNALLKSGQKGTFEEQVRNVSETCKALLPLLKQDYNLVIGHGNGPQVGNVMLQHEAGKQVFHLEAMPMDFCVAETQGSIGYLIELCLFNEMQKAGLNRQVVTLLTQVLVSKDDQAFANPTKPVGPYYTKDEADRYSAATGAIFKEDPKGNGWRKVVPSPTPMDINHLEMIEAAVEAGHIVVTVGGGGIPVIREDNGDFKGIEAVIDKDLASALTAVKIKADEFYILTDVPKVYVNFRKPGEKALDTVTVAEARRYLDEGQFAEGSMAPKIRAAIFFVENGGKECIITEAGELGKAAAGTRIVA